MRRVFVILLAAFLLLPEQADARRGRGRDHDDARHAVESGAALSLSRILPLALRAVPGEVLDVDLDREHGRLVYEVQILARDGGVRNVVLDARTGAVLMRDYGRHRHGDDDDDDDRDDDWDDDD